jgi:hypothetical protein
MEPIVVNYWAVVVGGIIAMVLGSLWYGPLFGKKWMEIVGGSPDDLERRKAMQKAAGPLYLVQFVLVLFQILVLAHLIADTTRVSGIERSMWMWAAFIIPTLAGTVMWTNEKTNMKWARFLIQGGYQLCCFIVFGLLLQFWK